ncbi:MAG: hypothetical protein DWQ08_12270 [Proteobacteria bacterium]|nr:MAG: hypothetical protein DWQ08_12270 [Pseudomonadota bacterium]
MTQTTPRTWVSAALAGHAPPFPDPPDAEAFADSIIRVAVEEGVAALLHYRLDQTGSWVKLPDCVHLRLQARARLLAAGEMAVQHELRQVLSEFEARDIPHLLIKGAPLAQVLYPAPHLRERCDTDIVFPDRESANAAWRLLEARGYERQNAVEGETISTQFAAYRTLPSQAVSTFDIHWRLNNSWRIAAVFEFDELFGRSAAVRELHENARMPSLTDSLVIACLHRAGHRADNEHNRLIWLYDIHLLWAALDADDLDTLAALCREKRVSRAVLDGLEAARAHFGTKLPRELTEELAADRSAQAVDPDDYASAWRRELGQLRALPTFGRRVAHVVDNLFPSRDYIMKKYGATSAWRLPWL